jgi:hypothetical protein
MSLLPDRQRGAASLLVALILMMAITVATLSVAHTQLAEQKIASNESWQLRLSLGAEAALVQAIGHLDENADALMWQRGPRGDAWVNRWTPGGDAGVHREVMFERPHESAFVRIEASAAAGDGAGLNARIAQWVRLLSVLAPAAEQLPPLVVNGCLSGTAWNFQLRPLDADSARAGDAAWIGGVDCAAPAGVDTHGGALSQRAFDADLWPTVYSLDREHWEALVDGQAGLSGHEHIYRSVQAADLPGGRWTDSLGSPEKHVILHFGADGGCPRFAPGVRIYGMVFIDASCGGPLTEGRLEIFGSLVVNGYLDVQDADLHLNHIQVADPRQSRLAYPVLRSVAVPGSWRDF